MWGVLNKKKEIIETIMNGEKYVDDQDDMIEIIELV